MAVLRYTGTQTVTFIGYGEVAPDGVFPVPDEDVDRFIGRPDVELVPESEPEPVKPVKKSVVVVPPADSTEG